MTTYIAGSTRRLNSLRLNPKLPNAEVYEQTRTLPSGFECAHHRSARREDAQVVIAVRVLEIRDGALSPWNDEVDERRFVDGVEVARKMYKRPWQIYRVSISGSYRFSGL